ncbi:hypothetical protein Clacol_000897 [Clathrus columnatus]|uniref:C2H2-type domain-containing protein n=1 Tax=Clathrus columnatus TaxID=1419009 RepID=A0AAV4ZZY0_9AGAM|nr:hypothetical protein Clacol_000897 [Clathrus columnatus]
MAPRQPAMRERRYYICLSLKKDMRRRAIPYLSRDVKEQFQRRRERAKIISYLKQLAGMDDVSNNIPGALETMESSNPPVSSAGAGTGTGTATSPNNNSVNTTTNTANSASAPSAPSTTKRYRATPAKTFACRGYGECRMVFSRSEHLARHVRKHTGERPFACHCGKQFSRLDNLRQHAQTVHADKQFYDIDHTIQEQNERMMRELTTLHTTISQGAKRDARKKAVQAASASQGSVGMVPGGPQHSPMHPSIHPHTSPHPSLIPTPMLPMGGTTPAHLATYPAPPGHVFPGESIVLYHILNRNPYLDNPGHMHAQSMSALPFDAPQHQATPRYGRGRPGTSAGYEGSGFDAHTYDPRRGGWPGTGPGGAGNQPQGGGNGGFDHPGHHHAHAPPHAASHSGHSGHPHHPQAQQQQQQQHPSQPGFREPPTAHTHPPPQEDFRDGGGGTAGGGMGAMGMGMMPMGVGMTHQHPPPQQHTEIGMGTPQSMASSIPPQSVPTSGALQAQGNQNTVQGRVVSDQQRSSTRQESGFGNNSNQRVQGTATQQQLQQQQQHQQQQQMGQQHHQQQQHPAGFGSPMGHHPMHHTEQSSGIRGLGQQRAVQGASEAGFGTHHHHSRPPTQFSGTGAQMAGITMHPQQQGSDSDSPRQQQPSFINTNTTNNTSSNTDMDMDMDMDTGMGMVTSPYQQQQQLEIRRQQNIGSGLAYQDGSFLERGRADELGSTSSVGSRGGGRRVTEEGEGTYPPSTATTALGASPSPGGLGTDNDDCNDDNSKNTQHSTHTTSKTSKSEPPPPRSGGGHSFLGGRTRNNDIDYDDSPRTASSTSSRREKERSEPSEPFARSQWYRSGGAAYSTASGPAQQYATISPTAGSSRDVYSFSSTGYPPYEQQQRAISGYDDGYDRRYPPSTAGGTSESSSSTHRAPSQAEQYQRYSRSSAATSAAARSSTSSEPPSPASSIPSATDASPRAELARTSTHERAYASPHDRHFSNARPQSSRTGVRYEHVPSYDGRFDGSGGSHRVFPHDAHSSRRSRSRSKPRHASYDDSRSKEYDSDSDEANDGGWGGRPVTAPAGRSWGTSGSGYGGYGSSGYSAFQYAPPPQYAYGGYGGWGYPQYHPQYPPPYPYPPQHHPQPYPYPYPPYGPAGSNRMDGHGASGMGRHGGGVYEREYTSESPFSFHPPGLERPLTGPGVSGESSSAATVPSTSSGRKRAAPDSEFESYGRPTTSGGSGIFAFGRPDTGNASRPQSRRLTVMEICNDVVPPGSSAGRFLPVSRPTTADSRVLPPPRSGISFAAAGVNPGPSPLRPGSSGGSPFAFGYPGDNSRGWEGERNVTPPTRAGEHSEEAGTTAGANADRSDSPSERDARSVSSSVKFVDGTDARAGQRDGGANDTAAAAATSTTATATVGTKSEPKSSSSSISSATPTASPRVRGVPTTHQVASDTRSPSSLSVSKSPSHHPPPHQSLQQFIAPSTTQSNRHLNLPQNNPNRSHHNTPTHPHFPFHRSPSTSTATSATGSEYNVDSQHDLDDSIDISMDMGL